MNGQTRAALVLGIGALGACAGMMAGPGGFPGPHQRFDSHPLDGECLKKLGGKAPPLALTDADGASARSCQSGDVVLAQDGVRAPTDEQLLAFKGAHEHKWMALPGVHSSGLGTCCGDAGDTAGQLCLRVYVHLCTTPLEDVARLVLAEARAAGLADAKLAVLLDVDGAAGPRCVSGDPGCEPTPYGGARYRDGSPRHPVLDNLGLSGGACAGDGECHEAGCGNHCVPWNEPGFAAICPAYSALESALCGCVSGQCTWFTQ